MTKTLIIFLILFSQTSESIEFEKIKTTNTGSTFGHTSIGDINNDGYNDIFVGDFYHFICYNFQCSYPQTIDEKAKVFLNDTKGGFVELEQNVGFGETSLPRIELPAMWEKVNAYRSVIADVNNDGLNDVVASDGRVFLNGGEGQFLAAISPGIGRSRSAVYAVDLDNDGVLEIINNKSIRRQINNSPLSYETDHQFSIGSTNDVKFSDFNNDNYIDILTYGVNSQIIVYLNDQNGVFDSNNKIELGHVENKYLLVEDVNNDDLMDILLSDGSILINGDNLQFEKNNNLINISAAIESEENPNNEYYPIQMVKYNDDAFLDLVVKTQSKYYVLINDGDGNFGISENTINSLVSINNVLIADFNNDDHEDFVRSNSDRNHPGGTFPTELDENIHPIINNIIDPVVYFSLDLYESNGQEGFITPSSSLRIESAQFMPFDINGDGKDEFLSIESLFEIGFCWYIEEYTPLNACTEYKPFYLSDVKSTGYEIHDFDLFDDAMRLYKYYTKGDFNNDGLDDLLVSYYDCDVLCDIEKTRIFINSENGLDADNTLDFDFLINAEITDLDGNGVAELTNVTTDNTGDNNTLNIVEILTDGAFNQLVFETATSNEKFSYADINNDGKTDILYLNQQLKLMVIYGNDDLSVLSTPINLLSIATSNYQLNDYNHDGHMDLVIAQSNRIVIYENSESSGISPTSRLFQFTRDNTGEFYMADLTGDGVNEIIVRDVFFSKIYQLDNNDQFTEIYKFPYTNFSNSNSEFTTPFYFVDMDNDTTVDLVFRNEIYFSRTFKFHPGLNYDPVHTGHGFSIENVAEDQFFTVFYSYDNQGLPEWYSDLGIFEEPSEDYWVIGSQSSHAIRTLYDYDTQSFYLDDDVAQIGSINHDKCSPTYGKLNLSYKIGVNSFGIPLENEDWCSQPIVGYYNRPQTDDMSGLWWAGNEDAGWGWSVELIKSANSVDMVVILYYYDGSGQPRWLIGQQSGFEAGQEITLDMNMIQGYGRSASPNDLPSIPAGTMSLTLNQASSNIISAGTMSIDVSYPGVEGGHWVRENIPIALFSTAR